MAQDDAVDNIQGAEVQVVPLKGGGGADGPHDPKVTSFLRVARNGDKSKLIDLIKQNCDIINASNNVRSRAG